MGNFDITRPRVQYTRPVPGPNPFPSEGAGDPSGQRFGGFYSLGSAPIAITALWVYTDGAAGKPQCTYSVGRIVPSGVTSGRSWEKWARSSDSVVDDSIADFSSVFLDGADPSTLAATTRYASIRWAQEAVSP